MPLETALETRVRNVRNSYRFIQQQIFQSSLIVGVVVVAIGVLVVIALKLRARYREDSDDAVSRDDLLLQFRDLHRQGGLSEDEYRSIKGKLVGQSAALKADAKDSGSQARTHAESPPSTPSEEVAEVEQRQPTADEAGST